MFSRTDTRTFRFFIERVEAESVIFSDKKYNEVLFPYLTADEMIGNLGSLPKRYVIDFRKHDIFSTKKYPQVFSRIQKNVLPDRQIIAKEEEDRNKVALAKNPKAHINHHHANFLRQWWKLSYSRDEMMNIIEMLPRYIACGQVTKRPIFNFISSEIHPNAALMVFPLADDYSFGILQSIVHWEWFTARCSTLKGDFRYTSNTVFNSFPWPQTPTKKQVREIADRAIDIRAERYKIMTEHRMSLRDLYRVMEETPANPVSELQDNLDAAVFAAYGVKKNDDTLACLLALNLELADKESMGEVIVGPGLPPNIMNPDEFITDDCIKMP